MPSSSSAARADAARSSSYPTIESAPSRVRFPAPASGASSARNTTRDSLNSWSGPSASRLRTSAVTSPSSSRSIGSAARISDDSSRSLAPADRDAILDRYRRVAPATGRSEGPSSRLAAPSSSRSSSARGDASLAERAKLARNKNQSRVDGARAKLSGSAARAEAATRSLRDLAGRDPAAAQRYARTGAAITQASGVAISVGISVGLGCYWGDWYGYCDPYAWCYPYYGYPGYCYGYGYWWGWGGYGYSWLCSPFAPAYWYWYGCWPYGINAWYPNGYSYGWWPGSYYSTVIYAQAEPAQEVQVVEEQAPAAEADFAGEGVARSADLARLDRLLAPGPDSAARASGQYLTLGDRAFREGRYADAVHFYARAVEFAPEEGVLYLVLSDGLFATGDYHYGAFALRKALEIDPTLVSSGIDKHSFYLDGAEFDRQLAQLESYLVDRPGDDDARLMLAANYLFGGRPAAAVDLLQSPGSERVLAEPAGALILEASRKVQYGTALGR